MQKVTTKITRAGRPCTGIAAFFYPVLAYIKQARFACGETPVMGTTCTQRLLFHTTNYITKHLHACQGKTGSRRIFFVHMADFMPQKPRCICIHRGSFCIIIPDTSSAGASAGRESGRTPGPDTPPRCRTLPGLSLIHISEPTRRS